jgi:hypothetical protein
MNDIVIAGVLLVILIVLLHKQKKIVKCPVGYYYAPWASACLPIGNTSSVAGISTDATRPQVYDSPIFPANRPSDEYYNKNL